MRIAHNLSFTSSLLTAQNLARSRKAIEAGTFYSLTLAINSCIECQRASALVREEVAADERALIWRNWCDHAEPEHADAGQTDGAGRFGAP